MKKYWEKAKLKPTLSFCDGQTDEQSDTLTQCHIVAGTLDLYVGGQQPNQKRSVGSNVLHASFQIYGTAVIGPSWAYHN